MPTPAPMTPRPFSGNTADIVVRLFMDRLGVKEATAILPNQHALFECIILDSAVAKERDKLLGLPTLTQTCEIIKGHITKLPPSDPHKESLLIRAKTLEEKMRALSLRKDELLVKYQDLMAQQNVAIRDITHLVHTALEKGTPVTADPALKEKLSHILTARTASLKELRNDIKELQAELLREQTLLTALYAQANPAAKQDRKERPEEQPFTPGTFNIGN